MQIVGRSGWSFAALVVLAAGAEVLVAQQPAPNALAADSRELLKPPKFDDNVLDLFTADARTKIGPGVPGGRKAPAGGGGAAPPGGPPAEAGGSGGSFAWSKLISPDNLEGEIKSLGPVAAEAVKTQTNFKSKGREKAQGAFTELALLFGVIAQFDGDVKWKKDALNLESAYARVANNCKTSSDATFKESQLRSQDLLELFKGTTPELPKAESMGAWHEVLNRPALMRRMEEARGGKVAKFISNKSEFKKGKDQLLREAQVLAVISEVIKDKGFESADDENYQKYAQTFQTHCLALIEAVKGDDPDKAQGVFAQINKTCDACHGDFR